MLELIIPAIEQWDEKEECFIHTEETVLQLEHSLVSIQEWESKWCKPFLSKDGLTNEETVDYVRCMTLNKEVNPNVYSLLTDSHVEQVSKYIDSPMTATWFPKDKKGSNNREAVTAEVVYYWMTALNIPAEYRFWHFNKLMTLIRVCNAKNSPGKKMSKRDTASQNAALNAARRRKLNTRG